MLTKLKALLLSEQGSYLIVGGLTTVVSLGSFRIFTEWLHWDVNFSNILSIALAILFAFFANKRYVFHSKTSGAGEFFAEFAKFVGGRLFSMGIEVGGVFLAHDILHFDPMIAKIATQVIVVIVNYFISKFFVFKK